MRRIFYFCLFFYLLKINSFAQDQDPSFPYPASPKYTDFSVTANNHTLKGKIRHKTLFVAFGAYWIEDVSLVDVKFDNNAISSTAEVTLTNSAFDINSNSFDINANTRPGKITWSESCPSIIYTSHNGVDGNVGINFNYNNISYPINYSLLPNSTASPNINSLMLRLDCNASKKGNIITGVAFLPTSETTAATITVGDSATVLRQPNGTDPHFSVKLIGEGPWSITASKNGYPDQTITINVLTDSQPLAINSPQIDQNCKSNGTRKVTFNFSGGGGVYDYAVVNQANSIMPDICVKSKPNSSFSYYYYNFSDDFFGTKSLDLPAGDYSVYVRDNNDTTYTAGYTRWYSSSSSTKLDFTVSTCGSTTIPCPPDGTQIGTWFTGAPLKARSFNGQLWLTQQVTQITACNNNPVSSDVFITRAPNFLTDSYGGTTITYPSASNPMPKTTLAGCFSGGTSNGGYTVTGFTTPSGYVEANWCNDTNPVTTSYKKTDGPVSPCLNLTFVSTGNQWFDFIVKNSSGQTIGSDYPNNTLEFKVDNGAYAHNVSGTDGWTPVSYWNWGITLGTQHSYKVRLKNNPSCEGSLTVTPNGRISLEEIKNNPVLDETIDNEIQIYPNPTPDKFRASIVTKELGKYNFFLMTNGGEVIKTWKVDTDKGDKEIEVDISNYRYGSYLLKVVSESGKTTIKRVFKHEE